jgi:hypothetical protein
LDVEKMIQNMDNLAYELQQLQHRCNDAFKITPGVSDMSVDTLCKDLEMKKNKLIDEINKLKERPSDKC